MPSSIGGHGVWMAVQTLIAGVVASVLVVVLGAIASLANQISNPVAVAARPLDRSCSSCGVVVAVRPVELKGSPPSVRYQIEVRMSDGSVKKLSSNTQPAWKAGDRVRLENGRLAG
jgi:hypothetical protein